MKKIIVSLLLIHFSIALSAQSTYAEAIQQGDAAFKKGKYKTAINKYFAAEAFDPSKKELVTSKVSAVFDKIENLKGEAEKAKYKATNALQALKLEQKETEKAKKEAEEALELAISEKSRIISLMNASRKGMISIDAVCMITSGNGNSWNFENLGNKAIKGTGFLTKNNYLYTASFVLPNKSYAFNSRVEFNFKIDLIGNKEKKIAYKLDTSDFITNKQLNFTRVKIIDNPDFPLSQWGYLEIEDIAFPQLDEKVLIFDYPQGGVLNISPEHTKIIAFLQKENEVIYSRVTTAGSSGAPVLNREFKVIAIHIGGSDIENGGIVMNKENDRISASFGTSMKYILDYIESQDEK